MAIHGQLRIPVRCRPPGQSDDLEQELRLFRPRDEGLNTTLLRAFAALFWAHPELQIRAEVCRGQEPALWIPPQPGSKRLKLWVELGSFRPQRLRKALSQSERVVWLSSDSRRQSSPGKTKRSIEAWRLDPELFSQATEVDLQASHWRVEWPAQADGEQLLWSVQPKTDAASSLRTTLRPTQRIGTLERYAVTVGN